MRAREVTEEEAFARAARRVDAQQPAGRPGVAAGDRRGALRRCGEPRRQAAHAVAAPGEAVRPRRPASSRRAAPRGSCWRRDGERDRDGQLARPRTQPVPGDLRRPARQRSSDAWAAARDGSRRQRPAARTCPSSTRSPSAARRRPTGWSAQLETAGLVTDACTSINLSGRQRMLSQRLRQAGACSASSCRRRRAAAEAERANGLADTRRASPRWRRSSRRLPLTHRRDPRPARRHGRGRWSDAGARRPLPARAGPRRARARRGQRSAARAPSSSLTDRYERSMQVLMG